MYLKSIEVQGFKSFANKINFEFHNGITAIVGPNGSGKSNVADAVRWVLGEQRIKQLRGGKMEDVIFAGTEMRKPLGFAFVAITLDNKDKQLAVDFEEVTVSRRLFRSGESEYMINGALCRLKDIHELFYDTGIGKEGYSIIGQGQIDKILSGKPEERRELFDEAAGIVKFKKRKAETYKKLDNEKANLVRVTDILTELEKQVRPLERQSEKAKIYLKLKDDLKSLDLNRFFIEGEKIKADIGENEKNSKITSDNLDEFNKKLEDIKNNYEELDKYIEKINCDLDSNKEELNNCNLVKGELSGKINVLNEQIKAIGISSEHYNERISSIKTEIEKYNLEKEELLIQQKAIMDNINIDREVLNSSDSETTNIVKKINEIDETIEKHKGDIISLLNEKSNVKSKLQRYDTMLEQINIRKSELTQRLLKFQSDSDAQDKIKNEIGEELSGVNKIIGEKEGESSVIQKEVNDIAGEMTRLREEINYEQKKYHQIESKLESLKNITERYEGYGNSIKKIMELKDNKKGIIGVVADIIKVEKKYEVAIETALGGNIQNIVTDNANTAKDTIEYLKKYKYGRATFLPLSSIANRTGFTNNDALNEAGVKGLASDLIEIKDEWSNVGKYLLGRVLVVDTIENALVIARKYKNTLRMVTLEGELLNPGGSMSGGAYKNTSNLLGRRREIEDLESSISVALKNGEELNKKLVEFDNKRKNKKEELEKIKLILNEKYLLQNTLKLNYDKASEKLQEIGNSYEDFTNEKKEISTQIIDIKNNYDTLNEELKHWDEKNKNLEKVIEELSEDLVVLKEEEAEKSKSREEIVLKMSSYNHKKDFIKENLSRIESEIERLNKDIITIEENASNSSGEINEKEKEKEKFNEDITKCELEMGKIDLKIKELSEEKEKISKEHKEFFNKREEISNAINQLDKDLYRISTQKEKLDDQYDKLVNYMWDEYEITFSQAMEHKEEYNGKDLSELKKDIYKIKGEIKNLGDVNVNSIEEYRSVSERYIFLKEQHDDLIIAEENLVKIIEELDIGMRNQFTEKFELIKDEFDKVFKILFGGGKGTIELDDSDDILEAGITIVSQPPGKKLQNMMQLSGGEKALTAIALLFAIQNLKPSPFCLLDEIEAALDDSNVVRYAKYLHKLTDHTQFIVITHRRGTMASADRLYGITMQEKGVSTLVSVDLLEGQLDEAPKER